MAFCFNWPDFDPVVVERARGELETALNRGSKPSNICDVIRVRSLHLGTQPPELEILEIGELSEDRFRGIFKLTYGGDARVVLQTKVQANPLNSGSNSGVADAPLIVPLELQISKMKLRGIFVLIVSLARGVTVSFKNAPLESVQVNSTFDSVPSIRNHLQLEIEQRLADFFREDLPLTVHQMSIEAIKNLAEHIPTPLRTAVPSGYFRNRRTSEPPSRDVSATPSRASSPTVDGIANASNTSVNNTYDEVYYFRRNSVIHRTVSKHSICDPLAGPEIVDLRRRSSTLLEDLSGMAAKLPLVGEDVKEWLEHWMEPPPTTDRLEGLRDPILFQSGRFGTQTLVINSGTMQLSMSKETVEGLSGTADQILRRPTVYKALRSSTDHFRDDPADDRVRLLDPDEFRSVDSLSLRPRVMVGGPVVMPSRMPVLGTTALQRAVQRGSLTGRLQILRVLQSNPPPFDAMRSANVVHRSTPYGKDH
ncbi:Mitochondrial distribution and morphology protein 34 [Paramicrosporidium saccamoebae]|uniref:Mitochondrial distribution and morphology protein 34 n=1 Tax=Paramicrosporidium saccamoebae TaxID=1246581 RepID=A0A2H9TJS0_9FUNG|nr:Mitochondrial distribution and morphology protein 34 [Paramicrosporidium saccamoebae]